jgi:hypothetical protein
MFLVLVLGEICSGFINAEPDTIALGNIFELWKAEKGEHMPKR